MMPNNKFFVRKKIGEKNNERCDNNYVGSNNDNWMWNLFAKIY